jgi:hypothetical protein
MVTQAPFPRGTREPVDIIFCFAIPPILMQSLRFTEESQMALAVALAISSFTSKLPDNKKS